jgi:hypothetical protein
MEDREYCLRYIAFVIYPNPKDGYGKDVDNFLNDVTVWLNKTNQEDRDSIELSFSRDISICLDMFDNMAFRKLRIEDDKIKRGPVNAGLFQAWLSIIHNTNTSGEKELINNKAGILEKFITLCRDENFIKIRATDLTSTNNYINLIKDNVLC